MLNIKTVFAVRLKCGLKVDGHTVPGCGQDAADEIIKRYADPEIKKVIRGHIINNKFVRVDLNSMLTWNKQKR